MFKIPRAKDGREADPMEVTDGMEFRITAQRIEDDGELRGRIDAAGGPSDHAGQDTVVVLDEPSTGLHMADLPMLLAVIHRLVDAGATALVIEHNPDVMREADWLIDLGPGSGPEGGRVVYQGPFQGALDAPESRTGAWLKAHTAIGAP